MLQNILGSYTLELKSGMLTKLVLYIEDCIFIDFELTSFSF